MSSWTCCCAASTSGSHRSTGSHSGPSCTRGTFGAAVAVPPGVGVLQLPRLQTDTVVPVASQSRLQTDTVVLVPVASQSRLQTTGAAVLVTPQSRLQTTGAAVAWDCTPTSPAACPASSSGFTLALLISPDRLSDLPQLTRRSPAGQLEPTATDWLTPQFTAPLPPPEGGQASF
jgi:hypothetical protein